MATSQHRCVFVGNIPYDATEEQLIQICEEVGPVVSFRLVIDRETGKPKGYGFCEYKDEETALSARRNLQGYEINGRQLRVDFAENDKGADRNREQGRGGPGMTPNVGAPAILVIHQPIGMPLATAAATQMAGALGGNQAAVTNQSGLQSQTALGSDPLTLHLAKMSRNQLSEILSELKVMAMQNKELARQLLLACPQLPKALFQAQIIVGMVTPQMLQMPNIRQAPPGAPPSQPLLQDGQPGLPPLAHNKLQIGQVSAVSHPFIQPQNQLPQVFQNQGLQQPLLPGQFGISTVPSVRPQAQPLANFLVRPQIQVGTDSSSLKQQTRPQPPLPLLPGQVGGSSSGHQSLQPSLLACPLVLDPSFQPGSVGPTSTPETINKDNGRSAQAAEDATWARQNNTYSNIPPRLMEKPMMSRDTWEPTYHPPKLLKLNDGRNLSFSAGGASNATASTSGPSFGIGALPVKQIPKPEAQQSASTSGTGFGIGALPVKQIPKPEAQQSGKQIPQFLAEIDTSVLQQLLQLTPEQVSSLPQDQQQLVAQIQQSLRLPNI